MTAPEPPAQKPERHWLRALRPLLWWLLLVLVLFLIHTHQRLSEQTHLSFTASLQGRRVADEARAIVDGKATSSGEHISIGSRTFTLTHPKAVPFSTNMFIWYGEHNLGDIALARSTGVLSLDVHPPAKLLTIRGPEFSTTQTNSSGLSSSMPTDTYSIEARYGHWTENKEITILGGITSTVSIVPKLGDLELTCNRSEATFKLTANTKLIEQGDFPAMLAGVPAGTYKLAVGHHRTRREETIVVKAGETNSVRVDFVYGAAVIETEPAGAAVSLVDGGTEWGKTPVTLSELPPGTYQFALRRSEYEPTELAMEIRANETNSVHTNLINSTFASALARGRAALNDRKYSAAVLALTEALQHAPNDAETATLLRQAKVSDAMESAEARASVGDHRAALEQVEIALALSPDLERAKQLKSEYNKVIAESDAKAKAEQAASERAEHPKKYFDHLMQSTVNSPLFDGQTVRAIGKVADIEKKVVFVLTNQAPTFKLLAHENPDSGTFFISASHGVGLGGRRRVDMVVGQATDTDVFIIFKVFEYALPVGNSLQALVGKVADKDMIPIHESRLMPDERSFLSRREEGIRSVRDRIQKATGD